MVTADDQLADTMAYAVDHSAWKPSTAVDLLMPINEVIMVDETAHNKRKHDTTKENHHLTTSVAHFDAVPVITDTITAGPDIDVEDEYENYFQDHEDEDENYYADLSEF